MPQSAAGIKGLAGLGRRRPRQGRSPTKARPSPGPDSGNAAMQSMPLLCGRCGVRVEISLDTYGEAVVLCPTCGEGDTLANARREAGVRQARELLSFMLRGADG